MKSAQAGAAPGAGTKPLARKVRWNFSVVPEWKEHQRQQGRGVGVRLPRPGLPEVSDTASGRPHYWSSQLFGAAHGAWETPLRAEVHPHPLVVADPAIVYAAVDGSWQCLSEVVKAMRLPPSSIWMCGRSRVPNFAVPFV